ncbi:E3 ubiquitin-protein ligase RNF8-like isoform X2 [Watersipora subatra]|uniref:E3 ubiquitin-protein ligase RNF8-like isoform X2 n=1 Tax=Watersipora subatra TaxID=2589382 RepID=UPI00355C465A
MEIVLVEYVSKYPAQQTVQVQDDVEEIVLGRSLENAVCIKSLCISRRHAVIRKTATGYEIQDQQAVNRIHVNGVILPSGASKVLSSHDHIQLGLKAGPTEKGSEYFIYEITFDENRKRKLSPTFSPANVKQSKSEPGLFDLTSSSEEKSSERSESTLKVEIKPLEAAEAQAEHEKVEMEKMELEKELAVLREQQDAQRVKEEALRQQLLELQGEQTKKAEELAKRLQDKEKEFEEVKDEQMRNANQMSKKLQEQEHELEKAKAHEKQLKVLEDELKETREKQEQLANISAKIAVQEKIADLLGDQLQCSICSELMIQPKSFACSHAFCSHCIEQWLKIKKECPVCRDKFTSATHNHLLSNLIQKAVEELSDESKLLRDTLIKEREEEMAAKNTEKCKTKKSSSRRLSRPPRSAATRTASAANSTITTSTRANRTITTTAVTTNLTNTTTSVTTNPTNASTSMPPAASGGPNSEVIDLTTDDEFEGMNSSGTSTTSSLSTGSDSSSVTNQSLSLELLDQSDSDNESTNEDSQEDDYYGGYRSTWGSYGHCYNCGNTGHWRPNCPYR